LTIEESMYVKFKESNTLVKNIVEINFLGKDMEKYFFETLTIARR